MANIKRVRCPWQGGGVIGPSVSTFYFDASATGFPASLQTFFQAIKAKIPDDCNITVPNTGDIIDSATGVPNSVWVDSGGGNTAGASVATFALGAGMRVQWLTAGFRNGRHVIGTTFIVPLDSSAFDTFGQVVSTWVTTVQTAASALVTAQAPHMLIYGKPHTKASADGVVNPVVSGLARSLTSGLRSRRT